MLSAPDFTLAVEAEKPICGRVTDARTGKPRTGVKVRLIEVDGVSGYFPTATTDSDGKYEIHGAKKSANYDLRMEPDETNGYLPCWVDARDTVGYEPVVADFAWPKGVVVKGTIRDKATSQPIPISC
jgi:hypothetical protein